MRLLPAFLIAFSAPALAQTDAFVLGNAHYEAARYDSALAAYESILEDGFESAALYYNIGNTHFKLGNLGPAALGFEKALRLDPGHDDAAANLELVASLAVDDITPLPGFLPFRLLRGWIGLLPAGLLGWLTAAAWLTAGAGLMVIILGRSQGLVGLGRLALGTGLVLALILGGTLLAREFRWGLPTEAVVLAREVTARSAPVEDPSLGVFTIHEATKVRIDDESGAWVEIVLADGRVGWIPADAIGII